MAQAMGMIGIGSSIAGGITSALGAKESSKAKSQMYNYQAGIAETNSAIAKQNADYARSKGETEAMQYGIQSRQRLGAIRATQGASGIKVDSGTAADVVASQKGVADMDMSQIRRNAAKVAFDFDTQSKNFDLTAGLYKRSAANAKSEGKINLISSFIGSASSVADKWLRGSQTGMWGGGKTASTGTPPWLSGIGDDYT